MFPKKMSNEDYVFAVAKVTWKEILKDSGDTTTTRLKSISIDQNDSSITHIYTFSETPPGQLIGYFATSTELFYNRIISKFRPKNEFIKIKFSSKKVVEDEK